MVQFNEAEKEKSDNNPCTWISWREIWKRELNKKKLHGHEFEKEKLRKHEI